MFLGYAELLADRILGDHLSNPWFDKVGAIGFTMFMLGLLFYWIHRRVNDARIYYVISLGVGVNGLMILLFGGDPYPHAIAILLFFTSLFFWLAGLVAVFTVLVVQRAPELGVAESAVVDPDEHLPRAHIPLVCTLLLLILLWLSVSTPFLLLDQILGMKTYALAAVMVVFVSVVAYELLPVTTVRETAFLGETAPPKELEDIFQVNGPVTAMEKLTVPMVSVAFWGVGVYFASNGLSTGGDDFAGAVFLLLLGISIVMTEYARAKRSSAATNDAADREARSL